MNGIIQNDMENVPFRSLVPGDFYLFRGGKETHVGIVTQLKIVQVTPSRQINCNGVVASAFDQTILGKHVRMESDQSVEKLEGFVPVEHLMETA